MVRLELATPRLEHLVYNRGVASSSLTIYKKTFNRFNKREHSKIMYISTGPMTELSPCKYSRTKEKVIFEAATSSSLVEKNSLTIIMKAAKIVRKDIMEHINSWQFSRTFSNYEPPLLAYILCKHIIQGTQRIDSEKWENMSDKSASL